MGKVVVWLFAIFLLAAPATAAESEATKLLKRTLRATQADDHAGF